MNKEQIHILLERYLAGYCTSEEKQLLELWFAKRAAKEDWIWENEEERLAIADRMRSSLRKISHLEGKRHDVVLSEKRNSLKWLRAVAVAASFLLLISVGLWVYVPIYRTQKASAVQMQKKNVKNEEPLLILADGSHIVLDSVEQGREYVKGASSLRKLSEDEFVYKEQDVKDKNEVVGMNRLVVPKGRDFKLTLSDGTKVWVNAATTLSYSTKFGEIDRVIHLDGEAYFEVTKNAALPFRVVAKGLDIEVLGTSFNVNAYSDEGKAVTTVAEGRVQVANVSEKLVLHPNQQAISYYNSSKKMAFAQVDIESALAWKNGYFIFDGQDITAIMKNISRWYDIEVFYDGKVSKKRFGGTFSKTKSITELLRYLESVGDFHFKQIGRRVIVMS